MIIFVGVTILFITGTQLLSAGIEQSRFKMVNALRYHVEFRYLHYAWGLCDILADLEVCFLPFIGMRVLKISATRRLVLSLRFCVPGVSSILSEREPK